MSSKGKILLVDDDEMVAHFLTSFLQFCDFEVDYFPDGESALAHFKIVPFSYMALFTDLNLGKMSGLELARSIKKINSYLPVFLCSGMSRTELENIDGVHDVVDHILGKPMDMEQLEHMLNCYAQAGQVPSIDLV